MTWFVGLWGMMLLRRIAGPSGASVATVAARRGDVGECFEIEFDDGLERLGGRAVGESSGKISCHAVYSACRASHSATA